MHFAGHCAPLWKSRYKERRYLINTAADSLVHEVATSEAQARRHLVGAGRSERLIGVVEQETARRITFLTVSDGELARRDGLQAFSAADCKNIATEGS